MAKIYKVELTEDSRQDSIDKIWSRNVLDQTYKVFDSLEYFPYLGRPYKMRNGDVCYGIVIHPFIYFYAIDENNKVINIFASYYGTQDYWGKFKPL